VLSFGQVPIETEIDTRVDVWSLGCTMYCIAFGLSPFESLKEGVLRLAILNGRYTFPQFYRNRNCVYSAEYIQLIRLMLNVNHLERPHIADILPQLESLLRSTPG
jgi:serine/threonine kinase 16